MDSLWICLLLIFIFAGNALVKRARKQTESYEEERERGRSEMNGDAGFYNYPVSPRVRKMPKSFMPERPPEAEPVEIPDTFFHPELEKYVPELDALEADSEIFAPIEEYKDNAYTSTDELFRADDVDELRRAIITMEILNRKY